MVLPEHSDGVESSAVELDIKSFAKPFVLEREFIKVIHGKSNELLDRFRQTKQFKDYLKAILVDRDDAHDRLGYPAY